MNAEEKKQLKNYIYLFLFLTCVAIFLIVMSMLENDLFIRMALLFVIAYSCWGSIQAPMLYYQEKREEWKERANRK